MASRSIRLAVIPGDGIGPEVVAEGLKVLDAVSGDLTFEQTPYDLGAVRWHRTGETLPDSVLAELREQDVILLGAVGDPSVPSGTLERGLLLRTRFELDHYVNLRPVKLFPGVKTPLAGVTTEDIDMVVVREGTEGPSTGNGGSLRTGTPAEVATEVSVNTAYGVERVVRDAYDRAQARPRKKLTLVHKNNVLVHAGSLWTRTFERVGREYPDVTTDYLHVDAATATVERATVAGREVPLAGQEGQRWGFGLVFHAPPTEGIEITLVVRQTGGQLGLRVMDASDGLSDLPGFRPRPPDVGIVGSHSSEMVAVARTYPI